MNWINIFGLAVVVVLLIPNVIYAVKHKGWQNKCKSKPLNIAEQIGRYCSMLLMVFNIGISEPGFRSGESFVVWLIATCVLIVLYVAFWLLYAKRPKMLFAMLLAVIPCCIFFLNGFMLRHYLLIAFAAVFTVSHIYVTYVNARSNDK